MKHKYLSEFLRYVLPNVLGMIGLSCYILADTYFIAQGIGSGGLAALNLAIPVYSFIHGIGLLFGMGGATRYSIFRGEKRERESNVVFSHTMFFVFCLAIFFVLLGAVGAEVITRLLGADAAIFAMCKTYLQTLLFFAPVFMLNETMLCFIRNDGAPQLAMFAMLGSSFSNIILDYFFIFPLKMGIFGAVLATGLAPILSLGILLPFFLKKKNHFHLVKGRVKLTIGCEIAATGIPSLVTEFSSGIVMIVFNFIVLGLAGNIGVAAYGVIANLSLVVLAIYTGIAQGIQPLFSKYYGMRQFGAIQNILKYALCLVSMLSCLIYGGVFFGADGIARLFNSEGDRNLHTIAVMGLKIYFIGCFFAGINIIVTMYFTSKGRAKPASSLSILRGFLVILPMAFLLAFAFGMNGLWAAFPVTEFLVMGAAVFLWRIPEKRGETRSQFTNF